MPTKPNKTEPVPHKEWKTVKTSGAKTYHVFTKAAHANRGYDTIALGVKKKDAQKMVKAVNMHDTLIETLQRAKEVMDRDGVLEKGAVTYQMISQILNKNKH